jgi:hypothetical protein
LLLSKCSGSLLCQPVVQINKMDHDSLWRPQSFCRKIIVQYSEVVQCLFVIYFVVFKLINDNCYKLNVQDVHDSWLESSVPRFGS